MATHEEKYQQAALAYLVYGLIYWTGGLYLVAQGVAERSGVAWFVIGALFVLTFPPLIWSGARWKGLQWFTRLLAVLVLIRVFGLARVIIGDAGQIVPTPWGGEVPLVYGAAVFLLIAAATCLMLARAGWDVSLRSRRNAEPSS